MPFALIGTSMRRIPEYPRRSMVMERFFKSGLAALFAVAVVAGSAAAGTAQSTKVIAFTGTYAGNATTQQTDNVVDINANGTGKGTLIGGGKITGLGKGDSSVRPCVPFTGTGSMVGTGGTVKFKVTSGANGCGDEAGQVFALVGHATVLSATGKLKKAKGTLKFTGTFDRSNGAFQVKFTGKLTQAL
jgi:hypothetical protein